MNNTFGEIITRLESQKAAIDRAIAILRDFDDGGASEITPKKAVPKKAKKRVLSEAGRQAIRDAVKKRWALIKKAKKAA